MNTSLPFSINLDSPYGDKHLYVNNARVCEFYSCAPSEWQEVRFASLSEAERFIAKHYPNTKAVYVSGSL